MMHNRSRYLVMLILLTTGAATAQPPAAVDPRVEYERKAALYQAAAFAQLQAADVQQKKQQTQRIYEDVEVMRRILLRKLEGLYPRQQYWSLNPHGTANWNVVPHNVPNTNAIANWFYEPVTSYRADGDGKYSTITNYQIRQNPSVQPKAANDPLWPNVLMDYSHSLVPANTANQWWVELNNAAAATAVHAEGAYLKDYGVTYHVTAPPRETLDAASRLFKAQSAICASCHANVANAGPTPTAKQPSEWDQIRSEVVGVKPDATTAKPAATPAKEQPICEPGTLAENILRVLSENGHNFSGLSENDKLTVIVTFRDQARASSLTQTSNDPRLDVFGIAPAGANPVTSNQPPASAVPTTSPPVAPVEKVDPNVATKPSSARDYELLADLHLKQGRFAEAIATYERAVGQKPDHETFVRLYTKLSEAHGKINRAKDQQAMEAARQKFQQSARAAVLPGKLILTVSKKNLNQVGTGKMSFEDFKKAASVEFLSFGPEAKAGK